MCGRCARLARRRALCYKLPMGAEKGAQGVRLGVLASGRGSNLQALLDAGRSGRLRGRVAVVISDRADAVALSRARDFGVAAVFLDPGSPRARLRPEAEAAIVEVLRAHGVEWLVLAGYFRIVGAGILGAFPNRVLNIHPSLLPSFPGLHAQRQAIEHGVKVTGCTVHFVNAEVDAGPILRQAAVSVLEDDTEESLSARILEQEHRILVEAVNDLADRPFEVVGRAVRWGARREGGQGEPMMIRPFQSLGELGIRPWHRGKVRETIDLGDRLLIVTTDRISAFDCVLPEGLPGKGLLLNRLSAFWFRGFSRLMPTHFVSVADGDLPAEFAAHRERLSGRWMLVRKAERVPVECVVRGYLTGSGWAEYRSSGTVCGIGLAPGLREFDRLPEPLFTPTTKAEQGHDEPLTPSQTADLVGAETARALERASLEVYRRGRDYALARGIIIADTKFEFGWIDGRLALIDEVLTPDSSRFWPRESLEGGGPPEPLDKQYVRDYLKTLDWDRNPPAPPLPPAIVAEALARYRRACDGLTEGRLEPDWGEAGG